MRSICIVPSGGCARLLFLLVVNTAVAAGEAGTRFNLNIDVVPGEPALVVVPIGGLPHVLDLREHPVRAASYKVLAQIADGSLVSVEPGPVRTLRGSVVGAAGSVVAASLLEDGLHARIAFPDGGEFWIEPAAAGEHVVYRADGVLGGDAACAVVPEEPAQQAVAGRGGGAPRDGTPVGAPHVAEIAADADFEYYTSYGSISAVTARIESIINALNIQYERDVGITHAITTIIVRTAEPDPYTATHPVTLLNQFRDEWLAHRTGIQRDVAQLFSGKDFNQNAAGYAFIGGVCSDFAFGVVQSDIYPDFAYVTCLSAHELGHNWGADHCACVETDWTMYPWITGSSQFHPVDTIPEILAFRDSLSCLDGGDGPPRPTVPAAPTGLTVWSVSGNQIDASWTDNSDDEQGFEIQRSLDGLTWSVLDQVDQNVTAYSDTGLAPGTSYCYRVLAYNTVGDSPHSNAACATTEPSSGPFALEPQSLSVAHGTVVGGGLPDLQSSDDSYLLIDATRKGNKFKAETTIRALCALPPLSGLDLTLEVGANSDHIKASVYLFNFASNRWVRLESYEQPQADTLRLYLDLPNPGRYVHPTSGHLWIKLSTTARRNQTPGGYVLRIDHVGGEVSLE